MKFLLNLPRAARAFTWGMGIACLCASAAHAQTRPSAAQRAAQAQAQAQQEAQAQANALQAPVNPGVAGVLLTQADAARTLGGYWRIYWAEDNQNFGVLQITGVNVADNQVVFEGQYSPDGLNTCKAIGNWVYSVRGAYSSGGATDVIDIANLLRMRLTCIGREITVEAFVVANNPLTIAGRAVHNTGNQRQTLHMRMRRFASSF